MMALASSLSNDACCDELEARSFSLSSDVPYDGPDSPDFVPARLVEVELGGPLAAVAAVAAGGRRYARALALVRLHTRPLGVVELPLPPGGLAAAECARLVWAALGDAIAAHLRADGLPVPAALPVAGLPAAAPACLAARAALRAAAPFVSVVVATRDRPASLAACLEALLALDYPAYEIIVVDNAPSDEATAECVRRAQGGRAAVRYVREARPGPSWARNRGLAEARGALVAFTDDDVAVDAHWLSALAEGFAAAAGVACVTGLVLPAELETPAQQLIEQCGGFGKGFARRVHEPTRGRGGDRLHPYIASAFGSGNNMAFRTDVLRALGGFDPALGPTTPALGGEELAAFFGVLRAGYRLVYEPAAFMRHRHRRDYAGLRRQLRGWGVGFTAYLTKSLLDHPRLLPDFAARVPYGLYSALSARAPRNARKPAGLPRDLTRAERLGWLYGPLAYLRSRRELHRTYGTQGYLPKSSVSHS
jgi:glycosyltransferase involved in cell wall biosynthesis